MKLLYSEILYLKRLLFLILILFWASTLSLAYMIKETIEPARRIAIEIKKARIKNSIYPTEDHPLLLQDIECLPIENDTIDP